MTPLTAGNVTYKSGLYSYHKAINLQQIHSCHILLQLYVLSLFGHQHKSLYRSLLDKKQSSSNKVRSCGRSLRITGTSEIQGCFAFGKNIVMWHLGYFPVELLILRNGLQLEEIGRLKCKLLGNDFVMNVTIVGLWRG